MICKRTKDLYERKLPRGNKLSNLKMKLSVTGELEFRAGFPMFVF